MVRAVVDPQTKIATILLNTKNFTVFQMVRNKIRSYAGVPGYGFDTYERSHFVTQHGISVYIPAQYSKMSIALIFGIIGKNYPQLCQPYRILQTSTFTSEGPNHVPGRRSRVGDMIVLIQGSKEFLEGLRPFPEDFRFKLSPAWSLTLKGGGKGRSN